MIKYIYFNTNENHWFDVANKLTKKIAEPILWLGDDVIIKRHIKYLGRMLLKVLIWHSYMNFQIQIMRGKIRNLYFQKIIIGQKIYVLK